MSDSHILAAICEIRDLVRLIAEPQIAARDKKLRDDLVKIVGNSAAKRKAVLAMDGSRTQIDTRAFDLEAIDRLLFLESCEKDFLVVSGDGLLHFGRLIAAGLASVDQKSNNNWQIVTYAVNISDKGRQLILAWKQGGQTRLRTVMGGPVPGGK